MKIRAKIPVGFKLLIEESFTGSDKNKIFVFEHIETKKKLYAKLCSLEDIRAGFVWEILTPEALKELNVEESVNSEYYKETERVIEETVGDNGDLWDSETETLEEYKRRKGIKGNLTKEQLDELIGKTGTVNINIGGDNQGEGKTLTELESENEDLKTKLTLLAQKRFNAKKLELNCNDPNIRTPEELQDWQKNHGNVDPTQKPSSGTLTLSGQTASGSMEFSSQKELIEFLQRQKNSPKASPEEKREAKAVLDELWLKAWKGKLQSGEIKDTGTPLLTKFLEEFRKRRKMSHEW